MQVSLNGGSVREGQTMVRRKGEEKEKSEECEINIKRGLEEAIPPHWGMRARASVIPRAGSTPFWSSLRSPEGCATD